MRTIIEFETPEELLRAMSQVRVHDDKSPSLPPTVYLVVDGDSREPRVYLSGEGSGDFALAPTIGFDNLFEAALKRCGLSKVHFT